MAVGSILLPCSLFAMAVLVLGDYGNVEMIIKHGSMADNLTVRFPLRIFKMFYYFMCTGTWTQCSAELTTTAGNQRRVKKVNYAVLNRHEPSSKYFTCIHNVSTETINCTMLWDDDDDVARQGTTECFMLRRGDCDCVGLKWANSGETILPNDDESSLLPCVNNCQGIPKTMKTPSTNALTLATTTPKIKTEESREDTGANFKLIITAVVVGIIILGSISAVIPCVIRKRRYRRGGANRECMAHSDSYLILENVSSNQDGVQVLTQFEHHNMSGVESVNFQQLDMNVQTRNNRLSVETDQRYVEVDDLRQNIQNEDGHYDVIVDNEHHDVRYVKMASLAPYRSLRVCPDGDDDDKTPGGFMKDNVYDVCNENVSNVRVMDVRLGFERQDKIEEVLVYSPVEENHDDTDTSNVFNDDSDTAASTTDNCYEDIARHNASNNNNNKYEEVSIDSSASSGDLGTDTCDPHVYNDAHSSSASSGDVGKETRDTHVYSDAQSEKNYNTSKRLNTSGIGDEDAQSTSVYSRLRNEDCKRKNPYDVLCEGDDEEN